MSAPTPASAALDHRAARRRRSSAARGRVAFLALVTVLGTAGSAAGQRPDTLDLATALELGRARSPALVAAGAAVRAGQGRVAVARSAARPALTADAGYVRYQDAPAIDLGAVGRFALFDTDTYLAGVRARLPLYTSGRLHGAVEAAESAADAATSSRSQAEVELTAAIAHAFDDVLLARALVRVADQSADVLRRALEVARAHYQEGTVARLDVLRAESRVSAARGRVRAARDALIGARERLAVTIGIPAGEAPPVRGRLAVDSVRPPGGDLADRLRATRPDLRALASTAQAARARARTARAAGRPAVGLFVAGYTVNPEPPGTEAGWGWQALAGVTVTWPVLDGGRARGEAAIADAGARRAEAEADQAILSAVAEARAQRRALARTLTDVESGTADVDRAERALAIAEDRYANGLGIQLDILEAETVLTQARTDRLRSIHAYRSAVIELKRVLGLPTDAPMTGTEGDGA